MPSHRDFRVHRGVLTATDGKHYHDINGEQVGCYSVHRAMGDIAQVVRFLDAMEDHALSNAGRAVSVDWVVASVRETRQALMDD